MLNDMKPVRNLAMPKQAGSLPVQVPVPHACPTLRLFLPPSQRKILCFQTVELNLHCLHLSTTAKHAAPHKAKYSCPWSPNLSEDLWDCLSNPVSVYIASSENTKLQRSERSDYTEFIKVTHQQRTIVFWIHQTNPQHQPSPNAWWGNTGTYKQSWLETAWSRIRLGQLPLVLTRQTLLRSLTCTCTSIPCSSSKFDFSPAPTCESFSCVTLNFESSPEISDWCSFGRRED